MKSNRWAVFPELKPLLFSLEKLNVEKQESIPFSCLGANILLAKRGVLLGPRAILLEHSLVSGVLPPFLLEPTKGVFWVLREKSCKSEGIQG